MIAHYVVVVIVAAAAAATVETPGIRFSFHFYFFVFTQCFYLYRLPIDLESIRYGLYLPLELYEAYRSRIS